MSLKMTEDENALAHFGKKGMRWGVRRKRTGHINPNSLMTKTKLDLGSKPQGYWEHYRKNRGAVVDVYAKARPQIKRGVRRINNDPKYKGQNFTKDSPLRQQYHKEISKHVTDQLNAASAFKGYTKDKQYKLHFSYDVDTAIYPNASIKVGERFAGRKQDRKDARETRAMKHAQNGTEDEYEYEVSVILDIHGYFLDFEMPLGEANHSAEDIVESYLEHSGVKGMRWGYRKKPRSSKLREKAKAESAKLEIQKTKSKAALSKSNTKAREEHNRLEVKEHRELVKEQEAANARRRTATRVGMVAGTAALVIVGAVVMSKVNSEMAKSGSDTRSSKLEYRKGLSEIRAKETETGQGAYKSVIGSMASTLVKGGKSAHAYYNNKKQSGKPAINP